MTSVDLSLIAPAFVAGLLVLATHVPLGLQVLARGIVFVDLAVAQLAALGVLGADLLGWEPQGLAMQAVAVAAALLGAGWLTFAERRWPEVQEALIGTLFVSAAATGILLVAHDPHGGEHLQDMLAGQILWVGWSQVAVLALVTTVLGLLLYAGRRSASRLLFYAVFASAVTASVQMVGVYLVFASLIVPALAVRRLPERRAVPAGVAIGAAGYGLGLILSAFLDLPAGAVTVWTLVFAAVLAARLVRPGARTSDITRA